MQVAYAKNTRRPGRWREEAEKQSYGALNAIGGMNRSGRYIYSPWDHCLRSPIDPVYRGPCPPNPDGTDLEDVYGSFYQDGTLTINSSSPSVNTPDGVTFYRMEMNSTAIISEEGLIKERTRLIVLDRGVYVVNYNFRVPATETVTGTIALLYDREIVPAMVTEINKDITGVGQAVSATSIIEVDSDGAELILGSTAQFQLTPASYSPILTFTIFSIA